MKNNYRIDFAKNTITLTKDFANKANIINSKEYEILRQLQKDFPNLTIRNQTAKTNTKKESHKDLTFDRMELFIKTFDEASLPLYEEIRNYFDEATKKSYVQVKSWFLKRYPEYRMTEQAYEATMAIIEESELANLIDDIEAESEREAIREVA
jgi:hypothetical protein